jgi:hypothetical protein
MKWEIITQSHHVALCTWRIEASCDTLPPTRSTTTTDGGHQVGVRLAALAFVRPEHLEIPAALAANSSLALAQKELARINMFKARLLIKPCFLIAGQPIPHQAGGYRPPPPFYTRLASGGRSVTGTVAALGQLSPRVEQR